MDFKEYLRSQKKSVLKAIAKRMWPDNTTSNTYLSAKLNDTNPIKFTKADEKLARKAMKELGYSIIGDSKKKEFNDDDLI